jgi:UDP-N-acetylglucosamine 4,6-dehydratase
MLNKLHNTSIFSEKNILITGGTGTIGYELVEFFLENTTCKKICVFSRDEFKQSVMREYFSQRKRKEVIRYLIGDIRDVNRLSYATKDINIVFHTAALKQVDSIEYNPFEAIKTNILGTQNLIDCCIENKVQMLVGISTDKSVAPVNLYGGTKLCMEKLIILSNNFSSKLKTCVLRYGNVLGSRGSVIPIFLNQKNQGSFNVTCNDMTRFTLTKKQACNFIINCASVCEGGEIFVPKLEKYSLRQLCSVINNTNNINIIGKRPGEKMHEEMICRSESHKSWEGDDIFIIKDYGNPSPELQAFLKLIKTTDEFSYNSEHANKISDDVLCEQVNSFLV